MASVIEPDVQTRRWRRVEYDRLVDLGMFVRERLELLAGWHVRVHSPLALDDESEPEPDVAIVAGDPRDHVGAHPSTAALVVEVADSSLSLDRRLKGGLYARAGLREFWFVNLVNGALEVHRWPQPAADAPHGWRYGAVEVLRPPATATPLAAPGTPIPVADLLP